MHVLQSRTPTPSVLEPGVPKSVDRITAKALAKKPGDRYAVRRADGCRPPRSRSRRSQPGAQAPSRKRASPDRPGGWPRSASCCSPSRRSASGSGRSRYVRSWEGRFGKPPEPVLVVLPYYSAPTDDPRPYYGAGFAEDLGRRLAHISGITVLGRSSVRASAGKPPQAAAAAVGAKLALAGSLRPLDDEWTSLEIETRLIDGRDGRVLWSRSHRSAAQDLVSLQADIAREVAAFLRVVHQPTPENSRAALRLVNPSAYDTVPPGP